MYELIEVAHDHSERSFGPNSPSPSLHIKFGTLMTLMAFNLTAKNFYYFYVTLFRFLKMNLYIFAPWPNGHYL